MAERRMFAKTIIDSDAFLAMPLSSQALYFHLSMRGDDEGFVNKPKSIQRLIGAGEDDLKLLVMKNFIIPFESGIVVIKHWKLHNYIRKDRITETVYQDEKNLLEEKDNGTYTLSLNECQTSDGQVTDMWQHRLGKDRLVEDSIGKDNKAVAVVYFPLDEKLNKTFMDFINMRKSIKAKMTDRAIELMIKKIEKEQPDTAIQMLEQSIMNGWKDIYPLKEGFKSTSKAQQAQDDFFNNAKEWLNEQ